MPVSLAKVITAFPFDWQSLTCCACNGCKLLNAFTCLSRHKCQYGFQSIWKFSMKYEILVRSENFSNEHCYSDNSEACSAIVLYLQFKL